MRRPRLRAPGHLSVAYYHCVSRVVGREFLLGPTEKEQFVRLMRSYEGLYGLRVRAYCVMSNHFHILVEVPRRPAKDDLPDDRQLVALVRECLGEKAGGDLAWELGHYRKLGATAAAEGLRERWFSRMWDVSAYMKILKQRFSQWYNGRHKRRGTLWEERFRSVLVEGEGPALRAMAAYIDLNPVRAGICDDPKDYRWCGYGEAIGGGKAARAAVAWLATVDPHGGMLAVERRPKNPQQALEQWRRVLFGVPEDGEACAHEASKGGNALIHRHRISRKKALEVLAQGGRLSRPDYLRCRVRYFTDGVALGSREFVESVFGEYRDRFGKERKLGARSLRGLALAAKQDRLYNLRDLRVAVFG